MAKMHPAQRVTLHDHLTSEICGCFTNTHTCTAEVDEGKRVRGWFPRKFIRVIKTSRTSHHDSGDQEDIRKQEKGMKGTTSESYMHIHNNVPPYAMLGAPSLGTGPSNNRKEGSGKLAGVEV